MKDERKIKKLVNGSVQQIKKGTLEIREPMLFKCNKNT